ncbi:class D sortase [Ectobacillus funiculus]|uniref:Class D sortase n=1 Tax=Ectobacillus funiculus TaxID=137993 RepID=A0ABV5WLU0_9BACI
MRKIAFFTLGILLCTIGGYLLYTNGQQFTKGNTRSHYKQIRVHTLPTLDSQPVYLRAPAKGEVLGTLDIPALHMSLPIYEGTDKQALRKGVGHYIRSVLPGQTDNCVLSGHNDSVFRRLDEIQKGDDFIIQTKAGIFTYRVTNMKIIDRNDKTVIVPKPKASLTITTCYPFRYIGYTSKRYVVEAALVAQHVHGDSKTSKAPA